MAKKIHITESQLKEIFKQINEDNVGDNPVNLTVDSNTNGSEIQNAVKDVTTQASKQGVKNYKIVIPKENTNESYKKMTKKSIKEARLQKLVKESVKLVRKKDLK